jgi:hypothetical protein
MTDRDNEARLGVEPEERANSNLETPEVKPLSFAAPTEMVDLPSGGRFYPEGHPLNGVESIEIKFMTAKEEDILTSRALLKKGVALDRLLESVIMNPKVNPNDMLIGDKNAVLIAARITGYGSDYETKVTCPACGESSKFSFDLEEEKTVKGGDAEEAVPTDKGTWNIKLPKSGWNVEVRLLTGKDEKKLTDTLANKRKHKMAENAVTEQFKMIIVSVEGHTDLPTVYQAVEAMPATDARYLREVYSKVSPGVDLTQTFVCEHCETETEMEVPFNTDFFWSRR